MTDSEKLKTSTEVSTSRGVVVVRALTFREALEVGGWPESSAISRVVRAGATASEEVRALLSEPAFLRRFLQLVATSEAGEIGDLPFADVANLALAALSLNALFFAVTAPTSGEEAATAGA